MISFQIAFVSYTGVKATGSVKFDNSPVLATVDYTNLAKKGFLTFYLCF
jgi:hypothetical protein